VSAALTKTATRHRKRALTSTTSVKGFVKREGVRIAEGHEQERLDAKHGKAS
jgi:hypothetical protein